MRTANSRVIALISLLSSPSVVSLAADSKRVDMQVLEGLAIDKTEVTVEQFALYAKNTGIVTKAEEGGGLVYEGGWLRKDGWNWRTPYGTKAKANEPAVHITFDEASAYCNWAGKRLPTEREWVEAAYTERRIDPQPPFETGKTYPYPTGITPDGANCLDDCGPTTAIDYSSVLTRGVGHAPVATTKPGVNGLYDMGANVWEWVRSGDGSSQGTLGGSWWYGKTQMRNGHRATKPRDMAVVYIGFRCVKDLD